MRPASFFWLFSSVLLLANAVPVPLDSSGLANVGERDSFEVNLEKRLGPTKAKAAPTPLKAQPINTTVKPTKPTVKPTIKPTINPTVNPTKATVNPTVKPATNATVKPTEVIARPTTNQTTNLTGTSSTPAATGTGESCSIKKAPRGFSLAKRGFFTTATAPASITITLGDKSFALKKLDGDTQGDVGIVYQANTGEFAKTNTKFGGSLVDEIKVTKLAGQLVASGTDTNCQNGVKAEWMVTKQSPGKELRSTSAFQTAFKAGKAECEAALVKARKAVTAAHAEFFKETGGFNHNDLHEGNVFFADDLLTAFLIDFGQASEGAEVKGDKLQKELEGLFSVSAFCPS